MGDIYASYSRWRNSLCIFRVCILCKSRCVCLVFSPPACLFLGREDEERLFNTSAKDSWCLSLGSFACLAQRRETFWELLMNSSALWLNKQHDFLHSVYSSCPRQMQTFLFQSKMWINLKESFMLFSLIATRALLRHEQVWLLADSMPWWLHPHQEAWGRQFRSHQFRLSSRE